MWEQAANGRLAKQLQDILEEAGQPVPPGLRQYAQVTGGGGGGGGMWPIPDTHSLLLTAAYPLLSQCLVLMAMKQRRACSEQHSVHAQASDRAGLAAAAAALALYPAPTCSRSHLGGRRRDILWNCWEAWDECWDSPQFKLCMLGSGR